MLTKHIITDKELRVYISPAGYIEIGYKWWVFRVPEFFCHLHFMEGLITPRSFIRAAVRMIEDYGCNRLDELRETRLELVSKNPCQIFMNDRTGEEIRINSRYYSNYTERADELTFWGTDRKSPVFAVNGPEFDEDNIVFMVFPINYN